MNLPTPRHQQRKTLLSFYCDDTSPSVGGARAFGTFLDFCADQGIAGEASAILGIGGRSITRTPPAEEAEFLRHTRRAWDCGIDTHMELMTHGSLFDFAADAPRKDSVHEGLWLYEPGTTEAEYRRYFLDILAEGERAGLRFTGLTWPGCGCTPCGKRYAELRAAGVTEPNPAVWAALLGLAREGRFRGRCVPCFFGSSETDFAIHRKAGQGAHGVYDLMPNAEDRFGIWENNPARVDPDYYISADGTSGIVVRHVRNNAPYCIWYSHWQGLNPVTGVGWPAFVTVIERIRKHLGDQVTWMRPSEIADRYHAAGSWNFDPVQGPRQPG